MIILVLVVLGLAFGSFVNALVWRVHKQSTVKKSLRSKYSISTGRSMCTHCGHGLAVKDLIPVLSWLWLRGKCRYCHKRIDDNPLAELLTPFLFVVSYLFWPLSWSTEGKVLFGFWLVLVVGLVALFIYDLRWLLLPNRIVFPLFGVAASQFVLQLLFGGGWQVVITSFWGVVVGGGIFWIIFQFSDGKWIGGGDVKLGWLLGALVGGPLQSLLLLFIASLLGTLVSGPLLIMGKANRKTHLPFGPFLIASGAIVYLFGSGLIVWYKHLVGFY